MRSLSNWNVPCRRKDPRQLHAHNDTASRTAKSTEPRMHQVWLEQLTCKDFCSVQSKRSSIVLQPSSAATNPFNNNSRECHQHQLSHVNGSSLTITPNRVGLLSTWLNYKSYSSKTYGVTGPKRFSIMSTHLSFIDSTRCLLLCDIRHRCISAHTSNSTILPVHLMARMYDYSF